MDPIAAMMTGLRAALGPTAAAYSLLAIGLNVHYGFTGLLNFGQVGFMLVGAYGLGISVVVLGWSLWVGILVGLLAAVGLAMILGGPTLRLRSDYFAITTIAAAEVLRLVSNSTVSESVTGGPFGLQSIAGEFYAINPLDRGLTWGPFNYSPNITWILLVGWALALIMATVITILMKSPWGRILRAIREDEDAARALGKNVFSYKMQSLVLGGIMGGLGGIVYTLAGSTVNPNSFRPQITFYAYAMLIIGGIASRYGPLLGAVIFWFLLQSMSALVRQAERADLLPEWLSGSAAVGASAFVLTGILLALLVVYRPQGLFGNKREIALDA
ncbi:MAG: branched-chain amino acid ABC transporter permease [Nitriliruptoraceae bacterium]